MEVLEIRPARVSAGLVAIGDMLVSSPIGADGPRPSRWIGAVTEHVIVTEHEGQPVAEPSAWRQWRIGMVDGTSKESAVIPADGWVWVHLPVVDGPISSAPAGRALEGQVLPALLKVGDHVRVREWPPGDDPAAVEEDEGVGIVRKVSADGDVWVDSVCNTWRGYPQSMFVRTDEPLSMGIEE